MIYLVGNKSDLQQERKVTWEEGRELMALNGLLGFEEVSCVGDGDGERVLERVAAKIVGKYEKFHGQKQEYNMFLKQQRL
jgi:hypothetical protein